MPSTRSSARQAAAASSSPNSSHSIPTLKTGSAGRKRKGSTITGLKSKRGRKGDGKQQTTIEATMPLEDHGDDSRNVEMNDAEAHSGEEASKVKAVGQEDDGVKDEEKSDEILRNTRKEEEDDAQPEDKANGYNKNNAEAVENGKIEPENEANADRKADIKNTDKAVENSSEREKSTPSSILEKGIIYFFFRGRVNIDEPSDVGDIARSYIVLRPMPHGSKLGDGPIGDAGTNRLLALPKKVLPASPKDRFMIFVEKANASLEEIKTAFASSNYATKTAGSRHTPAATPIGEGVYAIVSTGRESHLVYILTIPSELSEVQKDVGLQKRGSFVTSVKNPQYPGPANTNLPESPEYPQEILDEFRSLRWMPLQPKLLDYVNTQFLIIGHSGSDLDKATAQQPDDDKNNKDTPLEEIEKLEHEDELRVKHLKGDDSVFVDLGLSSEEYPKVQTTW